MKTTAVLVGLVLGLVSSGCSAIHPKPGAETVPIVTDREDVRNCAYMGEAIGVAGSWWYYWAISNRDLTEWARDDLRNRASDMGGNRVLIQRNDNSYTTSVVFIGHVYRCPKGGPSAWVDGEAR
ncbi:MAG: DUF4156 domain-containing protein [Verrucomicrobiota bacterium]